MVTVSSLILCPLLGGGEPHSSVMSVQERDSAADSEEGGRDTGPSQPLESGTGESDHEIACWTMTDWGRGWGEEGGMH